MMRVKRKVWPYLDCGLFGFWNILDKSSVWGLDHGLSFPKLNSKLKFKTCSEADKQQIHNMNFLSSTTKTNPDTIKLLKLLLLLFYLAPDKRHFFMLFDWVSCSSLQRSAGVHVEMVFAPDPTCAPAPTARPPHPVDPSQVVKQHLPFFQAVNSFERAVICRKNFSPCSNNNDKQWQMKDYRKHTVLSYVFHDRIKVKEITICSDFFEIRPHWPICIFFLRCFLLLIMSYDHELAWHKNMRY